MRETSPQSWEQPLSQPSGSGDKVKWMHYHFNLLVGKTTKCLEAGEAGTPPRALRSLGAAPGVGLERDTGDPLI